MRIELTLQSVKSEQLLSYNYQYQISSLLYRLLHNSSSEFATILHDNGLSWDNKDYKLFSFSRIQLDDYTPAKEGLYVSGILKLFISSPIDDFVKHLVDGIFHQNEIRIGKAIFQPVELQILRTPKFGTKTTGLCCSPLVVSTARKMDGALKPYYYRATDPEIGEAVGANLLRKHAAFTNKPPRDGLIKFLFDQNYLDRKSPKEVSKLITIKEGSQEATQIKGVIAPFHLTGPPELIEFAWHAGLGERTSQGFGFWEIANAE